ncbi:hypothetical protein HR09_03785 [Porphyromonas gulae]|uniref:T9SS type A sorting domain-containing protein n=1 Tax=Porphyromonas gulae TaxID=111105 RepID=UPI00052BC9A5|nr:T9SS type A sorting domain-containing protein [Porphyromonas gulae]KGN69803.1 hypothetical protein HR09_03785 [Porphyromonas gulae]
MDVTAVESGTGTSIRYEDGHLVWDEPVFSRVLLYDMQGRCVFRAETVGMNAVDLKSSLPAGIYLYRADDASGSRYSGKVNISQ